MDKKLFGDLAFGTRLICYGKTCTKIALNMANLRRIDCRTENMAE